MQLREVEDKDRFQWPHLLAWLGGILCALVPFIGAWEIGSMQVPVRFGSGNFGFNLLIGTGLCLLGGIVGGYWWRLGKWLVGRNDLVVTVMSVVLFVLGVLGCVSGALHDLFIYLVGAVLLIGLVVAIVKKEHVGHRSPRSGPSLLNFLDWLKSRSLCNALFYLLLFIVLLVNNLTLSWGLDISMWAKIEVFVGRVLTQGVLVGVCFLMIELAMRATPRYFRWTPWLAFSLLPLLVIADQLIGMMWSRPLINVVNSMTQSGSFKPEVELAASGVDVSHLVAYLIVLGVWLLAGVVAAWCWMLSKRFKIRISLRTVLIGVFLCWMGVVIEQGVGACWQNVADRQVKEKAFDLNLGMFSPPDGVGS